MRRRSTEAEGGRAGQRVRRNGLGGRAGGRAEQEERRSEAERKKTEVGRQSGVEAQGRAGQESTVGIRRREEHVVLVSANEEDKIEGEEADRASASQARVRTQGEARASMSAQRDHREKRGRWRQIMGGQTRNQ